MPRMAVFLILVMTAVAGGAGESDERALYPDLSEPKAAAFSLGVALVTGDTKTAYSVYIGDQKEFDILLKVLSEAAAAKERFSRAATARYGQAAATLIVAPADIEPKLALQPGGSKMPLTSLLASADLKQYGKQATLLLGDGVEVRLEQDKQQWKVVHWPALSGEIILFARVAGSAYDELAREIEQGKYPKAYEVPLALRRVVRRRLSEALGRSEEVTVEPFDEREPK